MCTAFFRLQSGLFIKYGKPLAVLTNVQHSHGTLRCTDDISDNIEAVYIMSWTIRQQSSGVVALLESITSSQLSRINKTYPKIQKVISCSKD